MLTRIISALIAIPIVVLLVFLPGGLAFTLLVGLAGIVGLLEFYGAAAKGGARPHTALGVFFGLLMLYFGRDFNKLGALAAIMTAMIVAALITELVRRDRRPLVNIGVTIMGLLYVIWLALHFIWLRGFFSGNIRFGAWSAETGAWLIMYVLLTTWALDTGAYFVGRFLGKRKLAPTISPGKTLEGAVGGFVSALIVGALLSGVIDIPLIHGFILGGIIGIVGQIGDLSGSIIKREVGIKDFGVLMPGHGGVLDRIDSLLFTVPVTFWYGMLVITIAKLMTQN